VPLKQWFTARIAGTGHRIIAGSFIPNGTGLITSLFGVGFTVTRQGVGTYRVTLNDPFSDFVAVGATGKFASNEATKHSFAVGDQSITGKWFEIVHQASADVSGTNLAAADITASGVVNKVNFIAVVARSDVIGAGV
jgi:hypothetical protein